MELMAQKTALALPLLEFESYCDRTNVETKMLKTCFSSDDLWLLEKLEERYGL